MPDLHDLLVKTSRTFALSIPYLPDPTRHQVTVAYLLFRIADTLEDAASWPKAQRVGALHDFAKLLGDRDPDAIQRLTTEWAAEVPIDHDGYQELMEEIPFVLDAYFELPDAARDIVQGHTVRTCVGMAEFVDRTADDGSLELRDLEDLRQYCYIVAGIVGELLTDLFLLDRPALADAAAGLEARSRTFGEALQLVNILKDASFDATEGRSYLPKALDRDTVFNLARRDLETSAEYIGLLQRPGVEDGLVAFNSIQVLLAFATLRIVEQKGPGAKISRLKVFNLVRRMEKTLERGEPVVDLIATV